MVTCAWILPAGQRVGVGLLALDAGQEVAEELVEEELVRMALPSTSWAGEAQF